MLAVVAAGSVVSEAGEKDTRARPGVFRGCASGREKPSPEAA